MLGGLHIEQSILGMHGQSILGIHGQSLLGIHGQSLLGIHGQLIKGSALEDILEKNRLSIIGSSAVIYASHIKVHSIMFMCIIFSNERLSQKFRFVVIRMD